jgi:hypothetical protein
VGSSIQCPWHVQGIIIPALILRSLNLISISINSWYFFIFLPGNDLYRSWVESGMPSTALCRGALSWLCYQSGILVGILLFRGVRLIGVWDGRSRSSVGRADALYMRADT